MPRRGVMLAEMGMIQWLPNLLSTALMCSKSEACHRFFRTQKFPLMYAISQNAAYTIDNLRCTLVKSIILLLNYCRTWFSFLCAIIQVASVF